MFATQLKIYVIVEDKQKTIIKIHIMPKAVIRLLYIEKRTNVKRFELYIQSFKKDFKYNINTNRYILRNKNGYFLYAIFNSIHNFVDG